jgi:hydrogenase maturation protease
MISFRSGGLAAAACRVKPVLVIGLGNPLMGDDGIGWHVAGRLAADQRLPDSVEVIYGGTDLLACADQMEDRDRVVLIDAILDLDAPGSVTVYRSFEDLRTDSAGAHHLSVVDAIGLLQAISPELASVEFTLVAIGVDYARMETDLSPAIVARVQEIIDRILTEIARSR